MPATRGALLDWGFQEYELKRAYAAGQEVGVARVWKGTETEVALGDQERGLDAGAARRRQARSPRSCSWRSPCSRRSSRRPRSAPCACQLAETPLVEAPVVVTRSVELGSPFQRIVDGMAIGKEVP